MRDDTDDDKKPAERKTKKKRPQHVHIGPYARAYSAGKAFCPVCDAESTLRMTVAEREAEKSARELAKGLGKR